MNKTSLMSLCLGLTITTVASASVTDFKFKRGIYAVPSPVVVPVVRAVAPVAIEDDSQLMQEAADFIAMVEQEEVEDRIRQPYIRQMQILQNELNRERNVAREAEEDLSEAERELSRLQALYRSVSAEKNDLEQMHNDFVAAMRARTTELSEANDVSETKAEKLLEENKRLLEQLQRYHAEIIDTHNKQDVGEAENFVLKRENRALSAKKAELDGQVRSLEDDNAWYDQKLGDCVTVIKVLEGKIQELEAEKQTRPVALAETTKNSELATYFSALSEFGKLSDENRNMKHRLNLIINAYNKLKGLVQTNNYDNNEVVSLKKHLQEIIEYMGKRINNESFVKLVKEGRFQITNASVIAKVKEEHERADSSFEQEDELEQLSVNLTSMLNQLEQDMQVQVLPDDGLNQSVLLDALLNSSKYGAGEVDTSFEFCLSERASGEGTHFTGSDEDSSLYEDQNAPGSPILPANSTKTNGSSSLSAATKPLSSDSINNSNNN